MKKTLILLAWPCLTLAALAQTTPGSTTGAQATPWQIVRRDGNSQVWQRTTYETGPNGQQIPHLHKYTELATGLNHLVSGQWVASKEEIDIQPDGSAAAINGQHQVYFPSDIYQGEIEVVTPDGQKIFSRPLGISYDDGANTVLIAQLKDSVGQLVSSNQIVYPDAFKGFKADLLYTYRKGGFEQDVVFRQQPPAPAAYGLSVPSTRLQLLTEFFNPPAPAQVSSAVSPSDGLSDTTLRFGTLSMVRGKAFVVGDAAPTNQTDFQAEIPVYKSWQQLQGRTFLVEQLPYWRIATPLQSLPLPASVSSMTVSLNSVLHKVSAKRLLPPVRLAQKTGTNTIQLAKIDLKRQSGVVLDYDEIDSDQTNFTFQGDTTYYVSAGVNLSGTTTFEGGSVIKLDGYGSINIDEAGTIVCDTASYRPAIFTSMNDDSVGEVIDGSSGTPATTDAYCFLTCNPTNITVHDLRFSYGCFGIFDAGFDSPSMVDVWNCQFQNVIAAVYSYNAGLHNVLIGPVGGYEMDGDVVIHGTSFVGENVTVDGGFAFIETDAYNSDATVALTNCLITSQSMFAWSYTAVLLTNSTVYLPSPTSPVYQTVGGGDYYLTNGSPYRGMGTTNINPWLLADLQTKTTWPPVVYSNVTISTAMTFSPQAIRDTNTMPDLGYHYDPLDYAFGGCEAVSNVTFSAGTAVGWFRTSSGWYHAGYGIYIANQQTVAFQGTATSPCYWVRLNTVQEQDQSAGYGFAGLDGEDNQYDDDIALSPEVQMYFTRCSMMSSDGNYARDDWGYLIVQANNSEFYSCDCLGSVLSGYMTNCLFYRANVGQNEGWPGNEFIIRNCTWHGGSINFTAHNTPVPVSVRDCAFDGASILISYYGSDTNYADYDYNAFTNTADEFPIGGTHDVIVTNGFNWQSSWLGNFYLPSDSLLIDAGDTTANLLGLYHFTTQTNQVPEGDKYPGTPVDIGYHYVATDAYGNPLDSNGDGIPDYLEDANGDGIFDAGDLGEWMVSPFGLGGANVLQVFTPLKP